MSIHPYARLQITAPMAGVSHALAHANEVKASFVGGLREIVSPSFQVKLSILLVSKPICSSPRGSQTAVRCLPGAQKLG